MQSSQNPTCGAGSDVRAISFHDSKVFASVHAGVGFLNDTFILTFFVYLRFTKSLDNCLPPFVVIPAICITEQVGHRLLAIPTQPGHRHRILHPFPDRVDMRL